MGLHTWHFNVLCNRGCYTCMYDCLHHEELHTCVDQSAAYTRHLHALTLTDYMPFEVHFLNNNSQVCNVL